MPPARGRGVVSGAVRLSIVASASMLAAAAAFAACGGDDEAEEGGAKTQPAQTAAGCRKVGRPAAKPESEQQKPRRPLDPAKTYEVTLKTNCGDFTITLDLDAAPKTAASFYSLARRGFFEQTIFHRIVPGFVIQGGDPTGSGMGGPGYTTVDRPPRNARYTKGVVAMAKTEAERPGTAGSQFFVVTGADAGLPPDFAVLGKVTAGLQVVDRIGRLGNPQTQQPTETVVIERVETTAT
jgi:peptidyl-prolyl cis-trans isomerase B (cyclophilin B)